MNQPQELPGWRHTYSGKVRDLYAHESDDGLVLVVASDRISAYDHVLDTPIPDKGKVLTQLSLWWFEQIQGAGLGIRDHLVSTDVPAAVAGRAMVCRRLDMVPVECVVRGYLTGSGLVEYDAGQKVCGVPLPAGLVDGSRLDAAIFTPARKAAVGDHDENVSLDVVAAEHGARLAERLKDTTLRLYTWAEQVARDRGILLADTKVEFGTDPATGDDELILGDEVLTPDSSRFWPADQWQPGRAQPSYDKQFVRDWLTSPASGWDRTSGDAPPPLPDDVVDRTRARYVEAYEHLTGRTWA